MENGNWKIEELESVVPVEQGFVECQWSDDMGLKKRNLGASGLQGGYDNCLKLDSMEIRYVKLCGDKIWNLIKKCETYPMISWIQAMISICLCNMNPNSDLHKDLLVVYKKYFG